MKPILARASFRLYSEKPGVQIPWLASCELLQFYPSLLRIEDSQSQVHEIQIQSEETLNSFKIFYDLLKDQIEVFLESTNHFYHFVLSREAKQWLLNLKRASQPLQITLNEYKQKVSQGETFLIEAMHMERLKKTKEVIFCGEHKKSEVEAIFKRSDVREYLPFLFLMAQNNSFQEFKKTSSFKNHLALEKALESHQHNHLIAPLNHLIKTNFSDFFVPHVGDPFSWSFEEKDSENTMDRFNLLGSLYPLLRRFFLLKKQTQLFFLPHLPAELHCGKALQFQEEHLCIDFEWSKKQLKRILLKPSRDQVLTLHFPSKMKHCRIQVDNNSSFFQNGEQIALQANKNYQLDRFEK